MHANLGIVIKVLERCTAIRAPLYRLRLESFRGDSPSRVRRPDRVALALLQRYSLPKQTERDKKYVGKLLTSFHPL
jgi:hypothetical protein